MTCNGPGVPQTEREKDRPRLIVTDMRLEAGASWNCPDAFSDYLVLGINGGDLINEKPPFLHVSLDEGSVTLLPSGRLFRLRNDGSKMVEFGVIEIQRGGQSYAR